LRIGEKGTTTGAALSSDKGGRGYGGDGLWGVWGQITEAKEQKQAGGKCEGGGTRRGEF